jgi:hypothetical protein
MDGPRFTQGLKPVIFLAFEHVTSRGAYLHLLKQGQYRTFPSSVPISQNREVVGFWLMRNLILLEPLGSYIRGEVHKFVNFSCPVRTPHELILGQDTAISLLACLYVLGALGGATRRPFV